MGPILWGVSSCDCYSCGGSGYWLNTKHHFGMWNRNWLLSTKFFSSEFVTFRLASLLFCESWFFTSLSSSSRAEGWGLTSHCWSTYCGLAHTTWLADCGGTQGAAGPRKTPRKYQSAPSHIIIVHRCQARTGCAVHTCVCVCVVHTGQKWCIKVYNTHCVVRGSLSSHSRAPRSKLELPPVINSAFYSPSLSLPAPPFSKTLLHRRSLIVLFDLRILNTFPFFIAFSSFWEEVESFPVFHH